MPLPPERNRTSIIGLEVRCSILPRSICPREESNLYQWLRSPRFYPLNYRGIWSGAIVPLRGIRRNLIIAEAETTGAWSIKVGGQVAIRREKLQGSKAWGRRA